MWQEVVIDCRNILGVNVALQHICKSLQAALAEVAAIDPLSAKWGK